MNFASLAGPTICALTILLIANAAISDLRSMRISNSTPALLALAFLAALPIAAPPIQIIASAIGAAALLLVCGIFLFCRGLLGGGDVKFAASVVLWVGGDHAVEFLFWAAVMGGVFSLVLLAYRAMPAPSNGAHWIPILHKGPGVPFAVPLAAAALLILPKTGVFRTLLFPLV